MSGDRGTLPSGATDQVTRAAQTEELIDEAAAPEDVIEHLKRELAAMQARDAEHEAEAIANRRRVAEERGRAAAAETKARNAESQARAAVDTSHLSVEEFQYQSINSAFTARMGEMDALKAQYAAAHSEGDGAKMADVQAKMALLGGEIAQLKAGKDNIEARKQQREAQQQAQPQQPQPFDRDAYIQSKMPLVQEWLRSHNRFFEDPAWQEQVAAAANYSVKVLGHEEGGADYIKHVNESLGLTRREEPPAVQPGGRRVPETETPIDTARSDQASRRLVAAPAGGSVPNTAATRPLGDNEMYLTREEKAMARTLGMTEVDYAVNKREGIKEGNMGPNARLR